MKEPKKIFVSALELNGKPCELYSIQIRKDGTNETGSGYLLHDTSDVDNERDRITGGVSGIDEPEAIVELSRWTADFRIDGNGYYIFVE